MNCRVQALRPAPRRHWPIFSLPGLPDGFGYCLVCWDYLTAVELFGACPGSVAIIENTEGCPVVAPMVAVPDPEGEQPIDGSPVTVAPLSEARDAERERTLGMVQRCEEHQL